ncbi:metal ABC transporter ATP-binding protein [Pseudokineococcus sp. 1T1Z-3]|uniref:metal ABC transporter ATP-binding protein n=1 Tax=Pseudokineococcus sp. 1T1Z-3 TaxID=3132745 RepID=UPI0030AE6092
MTTADGPPLLRLRGAGFGYGDRVVVHDVDLEVRRGERVALLGSNGSGKTTLLRGVLGLVTRTGGTVEVDGQPAPSRASRRRTGYVPQAMSVGGGVPTTVREVVATGRLPLRPFWRPAGRADRDAEREALEAVDMAEHADEDVNELSGGQQRRVLIARALAARPDLLVLDEPLAGVDAASGQALARTLVDLADHDVTLLVVTHEVGPLEDVVDRALVLSSGRLTYDGPLVPRLARSEASPLEHQEVCHHDDRHRDDHRDGRGRVGPRGWVDHPRTHAAVVGADDHPERHGA